MNAKKVGRCIQQARMNAGLTQEELGQKVHLSTKYISNLECGAKTPKLATFIELANALSVDANSLLADELKCHPDIKASWLSEKIKRLPTKNQEKVLKVVELLAQDD